MFPCYAQVQQKLPQSIKVSSLDLPTELTSLQITSNTELSDLIKDLLNSDNLNYHKYAAHLLFSNQCEGSAIKITKDLYSLLCQSLTTFSEQIDLHVIY